MVKSKRRRLYKLTKAIDRIEEDVRKILSRRQSTRYFKGIILMYSLIENILKWLVCLKIIWDKSDRVLHDRELESIKQFCSKQDFYGALNLAYAKGLFKHSLFAQVDKVRLERNGLVHQFYLFIHRRNNRVLRAKLQRLVAVADKIFEVFNALVIETGADDSYSIFMVRKNKRMFD